MKKKIAIILLLISSLSLVGCQGNSTKESNRDKRFIVLCREHFNSFDGNDKIIRVKDKVTGEEFIIYNGYRKGGITKADKSNK